MWFLAFALSAQLAPAARVEIVLEPEAPEAVAQVAAELDRALERAVPWLEGWTGLALPGEAQLVLHLYESVEPYRAALAESGIAGFRDTGAVTLWKSSESHLVVQPRANRAYLEAVAFLPELTLQLALHELVHQFIEKSGTFPTDHQPLWYAEGLAESLSARALERLERTPCLHTSDAEALLAELHRRQELIPIAEIFADVFDAAGPTRRGSAYAQAGSLFSFLEDESRQPWSARFDQFQRWLHNRPRLEHGTRVRWSRGALDRRLRRELKDLEALESAWHATLPRAPDWRQIRRGGQWVGQDLVVASFSWGEEAFLLAPNERAAGELDLSVRRIRAEAVQLGLDFDSHGRSGLLVEIGDRVRVYRLRPSGRVLVAQARLPKLEPTWTDLQLVLHDRQLVLREAEQIVGSVALPPRLAGAGAAWGVGVRGGAAAFQNLGGEAPR